MFANGNMGNGVFPPMQGFGGVTWTFGSGTSFGGNGLAGSGSYNAVQVFSDFKNPLFRAQGTSTFTLYNIALNKSIWNNCYPAVTFTAFKNGVQSGAPVTTASGCSYLLVTFGADFENINEVRMSFAGDRWFIQQIWTSECTRAGTRFRGVVVVVIQLMVCPAYCAALIVHSESCNAVHAGTWLCASDTPHLLGLHSLQSLVVVQALHMLVHGSPLPPNGLILIHVLPPFLACRHCSSQPSSPCSPKPPSSSSFPSCAQPTSSRGACW
jgi:hypothetical protein